MWLIVRNKLVLSVFLASVVGVLLGSGAALAHNYWTNAVSGTNIYGGNHSESDGWPWYPPAYSFGKDVSVYANASYPYTTSMTVNSVSVSAGSQQQSDNPWYGNIRIYDEYGNNSRASSQFRCDYVANHYETYYPSWTYSSFNSTNNLLIVDVEAWSKTAYLGSWCTSPAYNDSHKDVIVAQ